MATIDLSSITIPTPEPFDPENPTKQLENLAYVKLQIYALEKTAGFIRSDSAKSIEDVIDILADLAVNIDLGGLVFHIGHHQIYTTYEP